MTPGYESCFGLVERPFSLTPDAEVFLQELAHGRMLEALTFGLRRREPFLLVTGDLGVGKTLLRTRAGRPAPPEGSRQFRRRIRWSRRSICVRFLIEDFSGMPAGTGRHRSAQRGRSLSTS